MSIQTSMTLFEIGHGLLSIHENIADDGEIDVTTETLINFLVNAEAEKLDSYVGLYRQLDAEVHAAKLERERWATKIDRRMYAIVRLKAALLEYMRMTDQKKLVSKRGVVISKRGNGGAQPVHVADGVDVEMLPASLVVVKKSPDIDEIRKVLMLGVDVPGFTLVERGEHVRIG